MLVFPVLRSLVQHFRGLSNILRNYVVAWLQLFRNSGLDFHLPYLPSPLKMGRREQSHTREQQMEKTVVRDRADSEGRMGASQPPPPSLRQEERRENWWFLLKSFGCQLENQKWRLQQSNIWVRIYTSDTEQSNFVWHLLYFLSIMRKKLSEVTTNNWNKSKY